MKKLFTLLAVCLAFAAIGHAQTDGTFIFTDEQGNPVADGAESTVSTINDEGQMVVPLFVKNVSGQKAAASLYETIDGKPNGTWQTCAFGNCMVLDETGYSPKAVQNIDAEADIQTEWIPEEGKYASWKAKLQIHVFNIMSQSPFPGMPPIETAGTVVIGYGPTVTVNFVYADPASISTATASAQDSQYFSISGRRSATPVKGLNIVKDANGRYHKKLIR